VLSLVALVQKQFGTATPWVRHAVALGVLGTALFYCDALITPAVSVLSAVEGLELLNPDLPRRCCQSRWSSSSYSLRSSAAAPSAWGGCLVRSWSCGS
jgi:hypothetical protein